MNDADLFRWTFLHAVSDDRFYDSLEMYYPSNEFIEIANQCLPSHWHKIRDTLWINSIPPATSLPSQGWKIHVSSAVDEAENVLERAISVCVENDAMFKFACDEYLLQLLNSKNWPRGNSGKFITVYPSSDGHFCILLKQLYDYLQGFSGPYILSDRRFRDSQVLYYRYGGFTQKLSLQPDGNRLATVKSPSGELHVDRRLPMYNPPAWAEPPSCIQEENPDPESSASLNDIPLIGDKYRVIHALGFSNSGGVYEAEDLTSGVNVVIKESRPHVLMAPGWPTVEEALRNEHEALKILSPHRISPKPIELFYDWEHLFLVQSKQPGKRLDQMIASESPLLAYPHDYNSIESWYTQLHRIFADLLRAVHTIHQENIILGDLSPTNILVHDQQCKLIDLESSYMVDSPYITFNIYTPGFASATRKQRTSPCFTDDYFALGMLILHALHPATSMIELRPESYKSLLRYLGTYYGIPDVLRNVITSLVGEGPYRQHLGLPRFSGQLNA